MKKLFVICLLTVIGHTAYAQDVITLRSGNEIKGKVIEISDSDIRYKRAENLDGPTVVLPRADVLAINYENGTREVINPIAAATPAPAPAPSTATPQPTPAPQPAVVLQPAAVPQRAAAPPTAIVRTGDLLRDMQNFGPDLYAQYMAGRRLARGGWWCAGSGLFCTLVGGYVMSISYYDSTYSTGVTSVVVGSLFIATGITGICIGGSRKRAAVNEFNARYALRQPAAPQFRLNVHGTGVGLAMVF
ncbi:MAG: hypothetical protein LBU98_01105 [Alistipes sp.]|jgi:hypothetical protein|nr:hypothetical protein [Alistipes sp.]